MDVTEEKFDGVKVVACKLDGKPVVHCNKADNYDPKKWWGVLTRTVSGGMIGSAFAPVLGTIGGALTGYVSAFLKDVDETGYYNPEGTLILRGTIYKNEKGKLYHDE
jgi:hypothetical protein